jgi:hypothetical protein
MAIQSSYPQVAEQIINFNNNVVNLLTQINVIVYSTDPSVTVSIVDKSGVSQTYTLPSFGFLQSEINRLNNNLNSIYSINEAGALIQPSSANKFKKIVTVDLNLEPNDITSLTAPTNFKSQNNYFLDNFLDSKITVEIDLSGLIENNVRKILCKRYIAEFETDANGNYTSLGQSALNSFNSLFRNKDNFSLTDYNNWLVNTPGIINALNPKDIEETFDLEPNQLLLDGMFTLVQGYEDLVNKKYWHYINTLNYLQNVTVNGVQQQQPLQLQVNDELVVNTTNPSTRYRIAEVSNSGSSPMVRLERVEGNEPPPIGVVGGMKIYSPIFFNKKVPITVGYNERTVIFIKSINMDNYIMSKNWSPGIGFWTNDLNDIDSGLSLEQFYINEVLDYGEVLSDLVIKRTPTKKGVVPPAPTLNNDNFKVVQINTHLTDTPDSNLLKNYHNQQNTLSSEIQQINNAIVDKNKQLRVTRFTSDAAKQQHINEINQLTAKHASKTQLLSSLTNNILSLSQSPNISVAPVFHVRGFWTIPDPVVARGTQPQQIVQFRVQYRYTSKDGTEAPVITYKLADAPLTSTTKTAAFSNWQETKTDYRKRIYDATTSTYSWQVEDVTSPETPNINQLSIPIEYGEKVDIRIKSLSEVGFPDSPIESDWSNILTVEFPDNLKDVLNQNDFILKSASQQDLKISIQNDLSAKGLDALLNEQVTVNNKTYFLPSDAILSGFRDPNGVALGLFDYLTALENRVKILEDKIKNIKGQLEVSIYKNGQQYVINSGSETTFNVECEDYMTALTGVGYPSGGRVYANEIYTISDFLLYIKNKSVDNPLGLLSNRIYAGSNIDVYNSAVPQVFWVDEQDELIVNNTTGTTKTQIDNQFIWMINYDSVTSTTVTKLGDNIGNNFTSTSVNSNSLTSVLSSDAFNLGYSDTTILTFVGNNTSLKDPSKWIDVSPSAASTTKLLTTVHPRISDLSKIQETNLDKVHTLNGSPSGTTTNDIQIPLNIYFKLNAMDNSLTGVNHQYVNLAGLKTTVRHTRKLRFLLENEADNRPFVFTVIFNISRNKVVMRKSFAASPQQFVSNQSFNARS